MEADLRSLCIDTIRYLQVLNAIDSQLLLGREFSTPPTGLIPSTPNFRTTPPASSPDNPPIAHRVLPIVVIGIVLMVHQSLKPSLHQTLEA